jgi:hypothetical protein
MWQVKEKGAFCLLLSTERSLFSSVDEKLKSIDVKIVRKGNESNFLRSYYALHRIFDFVGNWRLIIFR